MISQTVDIVDVAKDYLVVKPQQSGCQSCSSGGCGVTNFASLFGQRSHLLKLNNTGQFQVGDQAELRLDESVFIRSVMAQYLLPLFSMFVFVLFISLFSTALIFQLLMAVLGLLTGMMVSRYLIRWYEYRMGVEHLQLRPIPVS